MHQICTLQLKVTVQIKGLSWRVAPFVAEAMEAGFLPALDKDQAYMFTLLEFLLYQYAHDQRLLTRDFLGYPSLFGDILCLSTRLFLSRRCTRIASYNRMNIAFLL